MALQEKVLYKAAPRPKDGPGDADPITAGVVRTSPNPAANQCRRAQIVDALFEGITAYFAAQPVPTATNTPGGPTPTPTPDADFCPPGHQRRNIC